MRQEIAHQLCSMQDEGIIHPSSSLWASSVEFVHEKDRSLRFCIADMKSGTVPLLHVDDVDDMLDQLSKYKCFSTLTSPQVTCRFKSIQVHKRRQHLLLILHHVAYPITARKALRSDRTGDIRGSMGFESFSCLPV